MNRKIEDLVSDFLIVNNDIVKKLKLNINKNNIELHNDFFDKLSLSNPLTRNNVLERLKLHDIDSVLPRFEQFNIHDIDFKDKHPDQDYQYHKVQFLQIMEELKTISNLVNDALIVINNINKVLNSPNPNVETVNELVGKLDGYDLSINKLYANYKKDYESKALFSLEKMKLLSLDSQQIDLLYKQASNPSFISDYNQSYKSVINTVKNYQFDTNKNYIDNDNDKNNNFDCNPSIKI